MIDESHFHQSACKNVDSSYVSHFRASKSIFNPSLATSCHASGTPMYGVLGPHTPASYGNSSREKRVHIEDRTDAYHLRLLLDMYTFWCIGTPHHTTLSVGPTLDFPYAMDIYAFVGL